MSYTSFFNMLAAHFMGGPLCHIVITFSMLPLLIVNIPLVGAISLASMPYTYIILQKRTYIRTSLGRRL
jgi:hypothetical protein